FCCLFFTGYQLNAQSWQWGKRGGSPNGSGSSSVEDIIDMTTDPNGNVYFTARMLTPGDIEGLPVNGYSAPGYSSYDIILGSYDCRGNLRWLKTIGGYTGIDKPVALSVDSKGHVYLTGTVYGYQPTGM